MSGEKSPAEVQQEYEREDAIAVLLPLVRDVADAFTESEWQAAELIYEHSQTPAGREALRTFAEWIVSLDDDDPESPGRQERRTVTLTQIVDRARLALGQP